MSDGRPTIPVGDIARQFKLPGWLRAILDFLKGTRIKAGPVDIQLEQGHVPSTGPSGKPHEPGPPLVRR